MGIGKNIQNALTKANITVAQLAKETKIPASSIYSIINRDSNRIDADKVIKIAKVLNCKPAELAPDRYTEGYDTPLEYEKAFIRNGHPRHPGRLADIALIEVNIEDKLTDSQVHELANFSESLAHKQP